MPSDCKIRGIAKRSTRSRGRLVFRNIYHSGGSVITDVNPLDQVERDNMAGVFRSCQVTAVVMRHRLTTPMKGLLQWNVQPWNSVSRNSNHRMPH